MIDLQLDPFSPGHEADLARVGEELAPEAGVGKDHLRVIGGWRALAPIDPWYPTARERRTGLARWSRTAGRVQDAADRVHGGAGHSQEEVDELRRHCGGPAGSAAHDHWRALVVTRPAISPLVEQPLVAAPPLAMLTDRDLAVLVLRSADTMADAQERLAAVEAGSKPTGVQSPFRALWAPVSSMGRLLGSMARGDVPEDRLVVRSKASLDGSSTAPLSASASVDHLRWRFADGSWLDVRLAQSEPSARREVLRRMGAAGVSVGPDEPYLLPR